MRTPVLRHGHVVALMFGAALAIASVTPNAAVALTPKSPDVVAAVKRGMQYLDSDAAVDNRPGARALQGICLLNHTGDPEYPRLLACIAEIERALGNRDPAKLDAGTWDVYSTGLCIVFLVEVDQELGLQMKIKSGERRYRADVECLLTYLQKRQKPCGGWGYPERDTGDTSMTQYGVLSSWIAKTNGYSVTQESIESVATWLLRTQDPSGGFGYQGTVAPAAGALVSQSDVKPSLTAAASGSLYLCAIVLGLHEAPEKRSDIPTALKELKPKDAKKEKPKTKIELKAVHDTEARAKDWLKANSKVEGVSWVNYYLYALERCMTFRAEFEQREEAKEPEWYNDGTAFLMKTQDKAGSWNAQCGQVPDTAFAVLFMSRATRKMKERIKIYKEGAMIGGRGIPKNTDNVMLDKGTIVARPLSSASDKLLAALEKPDSREFDKSVEALADLPGNQMEQLANKYGDRIRKLVEAKSAEARLAAVTALGKTRDLDNVETLIYALTDPDATVVRAANEGLLRIRRVPGGPTLNENFSEDERRMTIEKWKAWFHAIRPGVEMR
jgi:hypothetical protein